MAHALRTNDSDFDASTRAWDIAKSVRVCMLTTWDGSQQAPRPMTPHVFQDRHAIYFLDRADSQKEMEISKFPTVSLSFMEISSSTYLAVSGIATISDDRSIIKELWSPVYKTWWTSEDDPSIRLLTISPEKAEIWDGPNKIAAAGIMLLNTVRDEKIPLGQHSKVKM